MGFILNKICYDDAVGFFQEEGQVSQRGAPAFLLQQAEIEIIVLARGQPLHLQGADQATDQKGGLQHQSFAGQTRPYQA